MEIFRKATTPVIIEPVGPRHNTACPLMKVLDDIIASLGGMEMNQPVRAVWSCTFWTAVTTRKTGLASTLRENDQQHSDPTPPVPDAGALLDKTAAELVRYAYSEDTVAASIGMATINSLIQPNLTSCTSLNASELIAQHGAGANIGVVGHFPFVSDLKRIAHRLWVLEKRPRNGDLDSSRAADVLPRCDVVCLSATTLINHTFHGLMDLCRQAFVVLTGPSAPLSPVLFDHGVDAVCGTVVTDAQRVIRFISQAACFRQFKSQGVRLLTMQRQPTTREQSGAAH